MEIQSMSDVFESKIRITIMAALIGGEKNWAELKDITKASDGNLSTHLLKLENLGYIIVSKQFLQKKPRSTYRLTCKAKQEFSDYVNMLEKLIGKLSD